MTAIILTIHVMIVLALVGVVLMQRSDGAAAAVVMSERAMRELGAEPMARLVGFALAGGVIMGIAAGLARGCTSGQALSGGALLATGSWVFMLMVFAGGYATAWFVRRQWI